MKLCDLNERALGWNSGSWILVLVPTRCVTWGKSFNLRLSHLYFELFWVFESRIQSYIAFKLPKWLLAQKWWCVGVGMDHFFVREEIASELVTGDSGVQAQVSWVWLQNLHPFPPWLWLYYCYITQCIFIIFLIPASRSWHNSTANGHWVLMSARETKMKGRWSFNPA